MKFKKGDWVECINDADNQALNIGWVYWVDRDPEGDKYMHVKTAIGHDCGPFLVMNKHFRMSVETEQDHPTLTDFDRIRLETSTPMFKQYNKDYGYIEAMKFALRDADELINLILSTPFKRTK